MIRRWKRHILVGLGLGLVLGLLFVVTLSDVGYGRERKEWSGVVPKHYPNRFSGMGYIDRIENNEIVVDDVLFKLSTRVSYHTPSIGKASGGWFSVGKRVGFITNSKREIISLWLIVE